MHMRSFPAFVSALALGSALSGLVASCASEDAAPLYVDATYQLRCIDCSPRVPDDPVRDIQVLDGERGFTVECNVNDAGGKKELTFSAKYVDATSSSKNYELKISQARYEGKDPGSDCEVSVAESANRYVGKCTAGTPTATEPCQLSFKIDGDIVKGSVFCDKIPNPSTSPQTVRYLVAPFETTEPVKFEVHGCPGL